MLMKQFKTLIFKRLPNGAHFEFFEWIDKALDSATVITTALGSLATDLKNCLAKEAACMAWVRKNEWTAMIQAADAELDRVLTGFSEFINSVRHATTDTSTVFAANRLFDMLKNYGRVTKKPYREQIGDVDAILTHLKGDYKANVEKIKGETWPPLIEGACAVLLLRLDLRDEELVKKPVEGFPVVRKGIETVWRQCETIIASSAVLGTSPAFEAFIDKANVEIDALNNNYSRPQLNLAHAEPAPIERQPYTGYPCTPVPEVLYVTEKETLRLELGKDFNISYKDNVEVGNATCILHGKGGYRGRRLVTFIIAR
jgi:hypothetical protein